MEQPEVRISPTELPPDRRSAWEWYATLEADCLSGRSPFAWRDIERELGLRDLFYFLVRLLRRPDADRNWLFDRCREVQISPNGHLDLWSRDHYKSTIITFSLIIQNLLNNPELTIGILSHTRAIAKGFLQQIKREFEDNAILRDRYSDVLWQNPERESPKWSEDAGLIIKRKTNPKESSIEAHGLVDGCPQVVTFPF
jgi:hypothetical protein